MKKLFYLSIFASSLVFNLNANEIVSDNLQQNGYMTIVSTELTPHVVQKTLEQLIGGIAIQLTQNRRINTAKPILVTSFVRLDNLKKTTEFGRIIAESLIHELSLRGFNVSEFRNQNGISMNKSGEFFISRDTRQIKRSSIPNTYVLIGTYSRQHKRALINVRLVDNDTGLVVSTARSTLRHGKNNDCSVFKDCREPMNIKLYPEIENSY